MGRLSNHCGVVPGGLLFKKYERKKREKRKQLYKAPGGSMFPSQKTRGYLWTSGVIWLFQRKKQTRVGCFGWWSQHVVARMGAYVRLGSTAYLYSTCAEGNYISGPGEPEGYSENNKYLDLIMTRMIMTTMIRAPKDQTTESISATIYLCIIWFRFW